MEVLKNFRVRNFKVSLVLEDIIFSRQELLEAGIEPTDLGVTALTGGDYKISNSKRYIVSSVSDHWSVSHREGTDCFRMIEQASGAVKEWGDDSDESFFYLSALFSMWYAGSSYHFLDLTFVQELNDALDGASDRYNKAMIDELQSDKEVVDNLEALEAIGETIKSLGDSQIEADKMISSFEEMGNKLKKEIDSMIGCVNNNNNS